LNKESNKIIALLSAVLLVVESSEVFYLIISSANRCVGIRVGCDQCRPEEDNCGCISTGDSFVVLSGFAEFFCTCNLTAKLIAAQ